MSVSKAVSDEALRKLLKPQCTKDDALKICEQCFAVVVEESFDRDNLSLKQLDSYDDVNFLVSLTSDSKCSSKKYVLKIHNGVESMNAEVLEAQDAVFKRLHKESNGDILCPLPTCPIQYYQLKVKEQTPDSTSKASVKETATQSQQQEQNQIAPTTTTIKTGKLHKHAVRVLSFVPGVTLSSLSEAQTTSDMFYQSGMLLASIHNILAGFDHKGAHRQHLWDLQNSNLVSKHFLHAVPDKAKKELVQAVYNEFNDMVLPVLDKCPQSVIHGDFNDANIILVDGKICGVLDLGDMVYSYKVCDLAISMAYMTLTQKGRVDPFGICTSFLQGYSAKAKTVLSGVELSILPCLVACRLATSYTMGCYSYSLDPGNEYLLFHAEPAFLSLTKWRKESSANVQKRFEDKLLF
eukprot:g3127.t1